MGGVGATRPRTGEQPSLERSGYVNGGGSRPQMLEAPKKPNGLRMQFVEWIRYLNETGFLDMSEADIEKAFSNAVSQDLEAMAGRIEMVAATLRKVASKKPRYSEAALGDQKRPEQKVLEDC